MGRTAVVETDAGVTVMLTSRRVPPFSLEMLRSCGLDPLPFVSLSPRAWSPQWRPIGNVAIDSFMSTRRDAPPPT